MKKYKVYAKRYLLCFILGPLFMILESCGEFILPYINANIINIGAAAGDIPYILKSGLWMLLIAVGMLATGVLGANFAIRGSSHLAADLRQDIFDRIQKFSFANIDAFSTGSLITRITNDITQIQNFTQTLLRGVFRSPVMLLGALVMSFALNPQLALVIFLVVPLLGAAIYLIIRAASPRYTKMQAQLDVLNTDISETITNERVIKSFVREDYEKEKFAGINDKLMDKSLSALKLMILLQPISTAAINITTLAVVWFAGKQIMVGSMELGTLTAFITYLTQILMSLNMLAMIILQGSRAAASDRRIAQVLQAKIDLTEHINLKINAGELVGVIGSTGSGKSTLVSLIPRLYDVDEGQVLVDGTDVRDLSLYHLRESVSAVLQKNTLFSGTISENLRWGNEEATEEEMRRAAEVAHADAFIRSFPDGYETELGQGGVNLSGGQKQRLCIARALLKNPKILILDDSTSAVDTATEAGIRHAFQTRLEGVTKIVIAPRIKSSCLTTAESRDAAAMTS